MGKLLTYSAMLGLADTYSGGTTSGGHDFCFVMSDCYKLSNFEDTNFFRTPSIRQYMPTAATFVFYSVACTQLLILRFRGANTDEEVSF